MQPPVSISFAVLLQVTSLRVIDIMRDYGASLKRNLTDTMEEVPSDSLRVLSFHVPLEL